MDYFRYAKREPIVEEMLKSKKRGIHAKESAFELETFSMPKYYSAIRSRETGRTIGIIEDDNMFLIGDRVELKADSSGFIAQSILEEGTGVITRVRLNGTVRYGVQMDNGEFGYVTSRRIWRKISDSE